jgi:hypothetical protein
MTETTGYRSDEEIVRERAALMGPLSRYGIAIAEVDALRARGMKIAVRHRPGTIELVEEDVDERS